MNRRRMLALVLLVAGAACTRVVPPEVERRLAAERAAKEAHERAVRELWVLETDRGTIVVRLFPDDAPRSVAALRTWTARGLYDGTWFHRVVREPLPFVVQGGDPTSRGVTPATTPTARRQQARAFGFGTTDPALAPEATRRRHAPGAVALALRADGARAGPQFVIALTTLPDLDGQEPVVGQVVGGWSVVEHLQVGDRIRRARLLPPERIRGAWYRDVPPPPSDERRR